MGESVCHFSLAIDGNAVYEIDEDCEVWGPEVPVRENQDRTMAVVTGVGKKTGKTGRTDKTGRTREKQRGPLHEDSRGCFCCLAAEAVAIVTAA